MATVHAAFHVPEKSFSYTEAACGAYVQRVYVRQVGDRGVNCWACAEAISDWRRRHATKRARLT